jgi:type IV fimbrial biogenesis protein FimT
VGKLDGLTVIERAVLVAVASILAAASVPALRSLILDVRMTRQVNAFVHSIHLAKQEAHKQTRYVAICKSPDGRQCQHDAAWREGWMVFVNSDRDEPPQVDAGERVLQVIARYKGGGIGANRSSFVFRPFQVRSTNGTVVFCDARGRDAAKAIVVSYTGRPRLVNGEKLTSGVICQT